MVGLVRLEYGAPVRAAEVHADEKTSLQREAERQERD